jgi:hypothetical protein
MRDTLTPEDKLKLDLLALFTENGRGKPWTVKETLNSKSLGDLLEALDNQGLTYEFIGASAYMRPLIRQANLIVNGGVVGYDTDLTLDKN